MLLILSFILLNSSIHAMSPGSDQDNELFDALNSWLVNSPLSDNLMVGLNAVVSGVSENSVSFLYSENQNPTSQFIEVIPGQEEEELLSYERVFQQRPKASNYVQIDTNEALSNPKTVTYKNNSAPSPSASKRDTMRVDNKKKTNSKRWRVWCTCEHCKRGFPSSSLLKTHLSNRHGSNSKPAVSVVHFKVDIKK